MPVGDPGHPPVASASSGQALSLRGEVSGRARLTTQSAALLGYRWPWVLRAIVCSVAVYFASQVVPGIHAQGWGSTLAAVLLLGPATCIVDLAIDAVGRLPRSPRWLLALAPGILLWLAVSVLARVAGLAFQVDTVMAGFVAVFVTKTTSFLLLRLGGI